MVQLSKEAQCTTTFLTCTLAAVKLLLIIHQRLCRNSADIDVCHNKTNCGVPL